MKHKIFAIYDEKAAAFFPPFFLPEEGMAIRTFTDAIAQEGHPFNAHPADYTLFNIGAYDDADAKIISQKAPISLGNGIQFVKQSKSDQIDFIEESK